MKGSFPKYLAAFLIITMLISFLPVQGISASVGTSVFINEIHYDNLSTDANEAVEIAGPAGTDFNRMEPGAL